MSNDIALIKAAVLIGLNASYGLKLGWQGPIGEYLGFSGGRIKEHARNFEIPNLGRLVCRIMGCGFQGSWENAFRDSRL